MSRVAPDVSSTALSTELGDVYPKARESSESAAEEFTSHIVKAATDDAPAPATETRAAETPGGDDAEDRAANGEQVASDEPDASTADAAQRTRALVEYLRPFSREAVVALIDAPQEGFDGWWYGGALAPDGCIYYVPGGAKQVLRFDPATEERALIGPEITGFDDRHKYAGCVRAEDGVLYGIPNRAHHVLKIDVRAKEVVTFMDTDLSEHGDEKWAGGALGPDGCIYGTPCRSDKVLKIDAREQKVSTFNTDLGNTPWKYHGSALGSDGCIYAAPHDAPKVQQFLNKSLSTSA